MRQKPHGSGEPIGERDDAENVVEELEEKKPIETVRASAKKAPAESHVDSGPVEPPAEEGIQDEEQRALLEAEAALREMGDKIEPIEQVTARATPQTPQSWRQQAVSPGAGFGRVSRAGAHDTLRSGAKIDVGVILGTTAFIVGGLIIFGGIWALPLAALAVLGGSAVAMARWMFKK